jgi:hypothetical protein
MTNAGSDDVSSILVNVVDVAGGAQISVDVSGGPIVADMTGVFFDLGQDVNSFFFTLDPAFSFTELEGAVSIAPHGANIAPLSFNVGVSIGVLGIGGGDDFQIVLREESKGGEKWQAGHENFWRWQVSDFF